MTDTVETVTVDGEDGPLRLDRWFRRHYPALAHGRLEKLLRTGQIRV
ncbi:MAG: RluA family pseudouridine synthase, partial [Stellaceae bacterium]